MAEYIERTKELKPCPFCGDTHIRIKRHSSYQFGEVWWDVRCLRCGAKIENRLFDTESDAVFAWNRRESAELPHADVAPVRHIAPINCGSDEYYGRWIRCPNCDFDLNTSEAAFCGGCGAKIDRGADNEV